MTEVAGGHILVSFLCSFLPLVVVDAVPTCLASDESRVDGMDGHFWKPRAGFAGGVWKHLVFVSLARDVTCVRGITVFCIGCAGLCSVLCVTFEVV